MILDIIKTLVIPGVYLILVILIKKRFLDKKYDMKKSNFIADCLNALVILYFLLISDLIMAMLFVLVVVTRLGSYRNKPKK